MKKLFKWFINLFKKKSTKLIFKSNIPFEEVDIREFLYGDAHYDCGDK